MPKVNNVAIFGDSIVNFNGQIEYNINKGLQSGRARFNYFLSATSKPSWHSDIVATLSQLCGTDKMRVVPASVSEVVTTSLSDVMKTLPQRCYNVTTTLSLRFLGHFTMDYSDFFPFIKT